MVVKLNVWKNIGDISFSDDTDRISQHLVQAAREGGSTDNISVIVVLLRDASLIATTASNISIQAAVTVSQPQLLDATAMETTMVEQQGLVDSQANEVQMFNGTEKQKEEHMFGFGDNYAQNGTDISPTKDMDFYEKEKSNGKRQFDDSDDDFGPETDVDAVDDSQASPFTMDLAAKGCDSKMFEGGFPQEDHNRMFVGISSIQKIKFLKENTRVKRTKYSKGNTRVKTGNYLRRDSHRKKTKFLKKVSNIKVTECLEGMKRKIIECLEEAMAWENIMKFLEGRDIQKCLKGATRFWGRKGKTMT
ncbi:unnamed protein product [Acanthoscelides obtectus]|uniref:Uncharacterized protein n=1 Tax=Acanthoscelides obtectus TaxID=200917 RepID=A0A9P0MDD4_ACAOB|nr:unnamed protein product [Acanthoscelides obtectus]CAK1622492.1 hypothetical protein AOBTE_LOCUS1519 [Acanthoscelides obtectus]